jgi:predicted enzyme related to lactoylglutathione lyase
MSTPSSKSNTTLHTLIIQTSKMEEMATFYGGGLKLGEPVPTGGNHLGFQLPNAYLGFDNVEEAPEPSGVISLWFEVDDLDETFQRFKEMGAEIKYPPTSKPWGAILAALYDPDGNLFGLTLRTEPGE